MEFNSELKNKLNKHATEQSEKLSDLKELQSMQFYKNYYIGLNQTLKEIVACTRCGFSVPSFSTKLPKKKQVYKFKRVELFLLLFWHRPLAKKPASLDRAYQVWSQSIMRA